MMHDKNHWPSEHLSRSSWASDINDLVTEKHLRPTSYFRLNDFKSPKHNARSKDNLLCEMTIQHITGSFAHTLQARSIWAIVQNRPETGFRVTMVNVLGQASKQSGWKRISYMARLSWGSKHLRGKKTSINLEERGSSNKNLYHPFQLSSFLYFSIYLVGRSSWLEQPVYFAPRSSYNSLYLSG